jgi:type 1 glutamine amidotransferase
MTRRLLLATFLTTLTALLPSAQAQDAAAPTGPRVLFLTKSAGFQHSVIAQKDGQPSYAENVMKEIVKRVGGTLQTTKDAKTINAENLKNFDVVIFYTTGDLTQPGFDQMTPMAKEGPDELFSWIKAGGGFVGLHCASDTFHSEEGSVSPYIEMLGGEFAGHGPQFFGKFTVVDETHPAMKPITSPWRVNEEWYYFKNLNTANIHVLALLDPGRAAEKVGKDHPAYAQGPYPIAWCRGFGDGRVFYNAMGHREDVWDAPEFQQSLAESILWSDGKGELNAEPNYDKVVPAPVAAPAEAK